MVGNLAKLGIDERPKFDPYQDELQNAGIFLALDKEPEVTPKWENKYLNTEI